MDSTADQSITTSKGVEIKLGDLVKTNGSAVIREVDCIWEGRSRCVRGVRIDGSTVSSAKWLNPDRLKVVKSA